MRYHGKQCLAELEVERTQEIRELKNLKIATIVFWLFHEILSQIYEFRKKENIERKQTLANAGALYYARN